MKALLVGDTHFPWCSHELLNRILDKIDLMQPDLVVQMGDLYDFYSFSRYARTQNLITPKAEIINGRGEAEAFWEAVRAAAPKARRLQLLGNHDDRIFSLVGNKAPELDAVLEALDVMSLWRFDGVETQKSSKDEVTIEGLDRGAPVMLHHGHYSALGQHVRYNQMSTAVGHSHHGGVVYHRLRGKTIWELNSGYIADQKSLPLNYGMQRLSNSVPGYGVIDQDGPRFNPL